MRDLYICTNNEGCLDRSTGSWLRDVYTIIDGGIYIGYYHSIAEKNRLAVGGLVNKGQLILLKRKLTVSEETI